MSDPNQDVIEDQNARWKQYDWKLIPAVAQRPLINMALDEVLTVKVGKGERPPTIRVWGWASKCIVLGRFQSVKNEVDEASAREHGVEIVRRISGGGAMFIEPDGSQSVPSAIGTPRLS